MAAKASPDIPDEITQKLENASCVLGATESLAGGIAGWITENEIVLNPNDVFALSYLVTYGKALLNEVLKDLYRMQTKRE